MDKVASEIMGEAVLVGLRVSSRGEAAKLIARSVVSGVVADRMDARQQTPTTPANHKGTMYVALGDKSIAFFTVKQGFFSNSIGELLATHPRSDISNIDVHKGMISKFDIVFADGTHYAFECGKIFLKQITKMKQILGI